MYSVGSRMENTVAFNGSGTDVLSEVIQELVDLPTWTTASDAVLVFSQTDGMFIFPVREYPIGVPETNHIL